VLKLATHLHPVHVIKCVELYWNFAMYLNGVVLDATKGNFILGASAKL